MATVDLRDQEIWVRLTRAESVWSLCRDVAVPYPSIIEVEVRAAGDVKRGWFRVGTHLPRRYAAGRFRNRNEPWTLWIAARAERLLVITLRDHHFGRIVLELADPDATAREIRKHL